VTDHSLTWVEETTPNTTINYAASGKVREVGTGPVQAVADLHAVTRQTVAGDRVEILTFRGSSFGSVGGAETSVFYRAHQGGDWTPVRQLSSSANLTFSEVTTAGQKDGFVSVFMSRNVSVDTQHHDLFSIHHEYGTDLNVSANIDTARNYTLGEPVRANWTVRNDGARAAESVSLIVEDETGVIRRVSGGDLAVIGPGERVRGTVTFQANRSRTITVRVADTTGEELRVDNDVTTLPLMRSNLQLEAIEREPAREGVAYVTTVRNEGPVTARNVTPGITNNGYLVANASIGDLPPDTSTTVRLVAPSNRTNAALVTRIRADPTDRIDESNETTGTQRVAPPRPDLLVTGAGIEAIVEVPGNDSRLNVTVGNRGFAGATATVKATVGNHTVNRNVTLAGTRSNATRFRTVRFPKNEFQLTPGERITVEVRPATLDARPADNVAATTVRAVRSNPFDEPIVPGGEIPKDPDNDGLYEDIDGNGEQTLDDAFGLAFHAVPEADELISEQEMTLDFDGNGELEFDDVFTLAFGG
jgi:hypothetical protein